MLSSQQKAIRRAAQSQAAPDSAASEELGMRVRLAFGNREISVTTLTSRVMGRMVEAVLL
jgi:hypothetical protein